MDKEVLDFIKRRFGDTDARWQDGNCYWFAKILVERFPWLKIYYDTMEGHFVAGIPGGPFFDSRGYASDGESIYLRLDDIRDNDKLWYDRLMRDCRD